MTVEYSVTAQKQLAKLDRQVQKQIKDYMDKISESGLTGGLGCSIV